MLVANALMDVVDSFHFSSVWGSGREEECDGGGEVGFYCKWGRGKCGRVKMEPSVLLAFFAQFYRHFVQFEAHLCDKANCGLVGCALVL